ncbi:uncharacterized protein LOC119838762 [Zerene cesonia]|uniref:uncharacterized protein LOC119838762 n=1 Tax=Zerene cesonia TaxID=33412 RepID=UPI0018E4EE50|nr:uncharacterized protein LOC119838762 [Zerene cesonia]
MEEELSENELEERMYSTLHYVDDTQANSTDSLNAKDGEQIDIVPRSTVRRYWRTSGDQNTQYRKVNSPQTTANNTEKQQQNPKLNEAKQQKLNQQNNNQSKCKPSEINPSKSKPEEKDQPPKEEKSNLSNETADLSIFQQPVSKNLKKTIEILDIDDDCRVVDIQSSDEDEVIEVALPPKPTITIESSDEDEICPVTIVSPSKENNGKNISESRVLREVSSSPVPSVVSSVSDEFIRGDCIALNISSRHNNNQSFDFGLHGTDLLGQTPLKKKKKKNKNSATSTPIPNQIVTSINNSVDSCFATPKSKAKNKKKAKASKSQKNIMNVDCYDSDSNLSLIESNKSYTVTEKSFPSADVYESDSNQSVQIKVQSTKHQEISSTEVDSSDGSVTDKPEEVNTIPSNVINDSDVTIINDSDLVDLTAPEPVIDENIVMANVTGFPEDDDDELIDVDSATKLGSTKIPAILCEDLDFDNLKGNQVFKRRRYSLTTLRAEMEKFYNESWGGENFNHREIQKNMSRDKSLWVIDPKDRMPSMTKRKITCNYCNRIGHRDDACKWKPPLCFMCGSEGHYEPRCPRKICVNCGSPNHIYSNMCRNCSNWHNINCKECGQNGHPASHCPDIWRRYHNTIDVTLKLEQNLQTKKHYQHFCSGCTRRGHLVHACRNTLPFSGLPINSPYVFSYNPIYTNIPNENINPNRNKNVQPDTTIVVDSPNSRMDRNKRQSKSPVVHETHLNKKRLTSVSESGDAGRNPKSPLIHNKNAPQNQVDSAKCIVTNKSSITEESNKNTNVEAAPDFIPINNSNHNEKGQIIQDNEVSDTSEVITSARIYLTSEMKEALKTEEGKNWLKEAKDRNKITIDFNDADIFVSIMGSVGDQEAFQSELREWTRSKHLDQSHTEVNKSKQYQPQLCVDMPRKRITLLKKVTEALESLNRNIGDPNTLFKELKYLQNRHGQLLKTKVVSSAQLDNNRDNMKRMMKKLNMILLGQAGLAGGMEHLSKLYDLQRRLTNLRQNTVSKTLRDEIGQHFHSIFSSLPRDDYADLVNKFYVGHNNTLTYKKKNDKVFRIGPKPQKKSVLFVPRNSDVRDAEETDKNAPKTRKLQKSLNKLVFYHRRLVNSSPADSKSIRTRHFLVQKLHNNIARLGTLTSISTTAVKKLQRIQDEAQMFLSNV